MEFYRGLGWALIISMVIWAGIAALLTGFCGFAGKPGFGT